MDMAKPRSAFVQLFILNMPRIKKYASVFLCVCVCVCVHERERERDFVVL